MKNRFMYKKILSTLEAPLEDGKPNYGALQDILTELPPSLKATLKRHSKGCQITRKEDEIYITHSIPDPCDYIYFVRVVGLHIMGDEGPETEEEKYEGEEYSTCEHLAEFLYYFLGFNDIEFPEESLLEKRLLVLETKIDSLGEKIETLIWQMNKS